MQRGRNVVLVGPMGAGKSTIGRMLAEMLGYTFCDTDELIEERTGANIAWIFDVEGEQGFRDRESAMIRELAHGSRMVMATGGGAVLREENRRALSSIGTVVYLQTSVDQQLRRTRRDRKRPLIQTSDRAAVLTDILAKRDPLYREIADLMVRTDKRGERAVARDIADQLRGETPKVEPA